MTKNYMDFMEKLSENRDDFDFQGPMQLYKKSGFVEVARENGQAIMRKML